MSFNNQMRKAILGLRQVQLFVVAALVLAGSRRVAAQGIPAPGTYSIAGAGLDTSASRIATVFRFPFTFVGVGVIDTGWVIIGGSDGRAVSLHLTYIATGHEAAASKHWNGMLVGGSEGNVFQFIDSTSATSLGYFHVKANGDRFFFPGGSVRMKLVIQPNAGGNAKRPRKPPQR